MDSIWRCATGVPRGRFIAAKLVALALAAALFVILPLLMNAFLALPIAAWNNAPFLSGTLDAAWFGDLAAIVGRTYLLVLMPMAIAFFVALISRSQAAGIGAALGLMSDEQIVSVLLLSLDQPWTRTVAALLPGRNSQVLLNHNTFGMVQPMSGLPGEPRAILTLVLYGAVSLAIAVFAFRWRDVRGVA
jgi:ABC-type transport system involved in multi-copper enzyme maturation permease subunit